MLPLFVTFGKKQNEVRVHSQDRVESIKGRLQIMTGWSPASMTLSLYDRTDELVGHSLLDQASLAEYGVAPYYRIHVHSPEAQAVSQAFEDTSAVPKYEMPLEEYKRRPNNALEFREKMGLLFPDLKTSSPTSEEETERIRTLHLGARVRIQLRSDREGKMATLLYLGPLQGDEGQWVGVRYDEEVGKHDGIHQGHRYFQTDPGHGAFVRPHTVHLVVPTQEELADLEEF